ncbi:Leucine-Rich Repeat-Containing Protein 47 [Manis pentadactyla]|nr:Leucine-Rich Repeat-Containing Protein 47 [Manis pentadactyla]
MIRMRTFGDCICKDNLSQAEMEAPVWTVFAPPPGPSQGLPHHPLALRTSPQGPGGSKDTRGPLPPSVVVAAA